MPARSTSKYSNRNTETKTRPNSPFHLTHNRLKTNSLVFGLHVGRGARHPAHRVRPLAAVQRDDNGNRAALLPEHRRQTAYIRRQRPAPALPEPEGRSTNEYYLNGFSSSLPWEIQLEALHKIRGFEDLHIYRPGYAIEYDYFPPTQLHHSLETKLVSALYFAGQVNGTTGYEEAAAQGLMAGINAHRMLKGEEAVVLQRDEAYIGVLIDDLVTKGVDEPYRMFTSRAEYRILLRQDNADIRLTPIGYKIGLITQKRYDYFVKKNTLVESLISFTRQQSIKAAEINDYLKAINSEPLSQGRKLYDILMRNNVSFDSLQAVLPKLRKFIETNRMEEEVIEEAEIQIKYKGYIEREKFIAEKLHRLENIRIPADFDFHSMNSLTIEARQNYPEFGLKTSGKPLAYPEFLPQT